MILNRPKLSGTGISERITSHDLNKVFKQTIDNIKPLIVYRQQMHYLILNIAMNKSHVKVLIDRMTWFCLEVNRHYFNVVKGKMDIFFMGNDFGTPN